MLLLSKPTRVRVLHILKGISAYIGVNLEKLLKIEILRVSVMLECNLKHLRCVFTSESTNKSRYTSTYDMKIRRVAVFAYNITYVSKDLI